MQEFIIIDGLPYLLHCGKAYAVRWDDKGFTVGGIVREGISSTDFPIMSELSVKAKCHGRLDSIGKPQEPEAPKEEVTQEPEAPKEEVTQEPEAPKEEVTQEPEATEAPKPKRGRKAKGDAQ